MWYWRRLLRVPWTARRSSQSILREISPRCSLEGLMLKVKLQYLVHLIQRADSFEKTLMLERLRAEWEGVTAHEMVGWHHQFNGHAFGQTLGLGDGQGGLACYSPWGCKESDMTEQLNWTDLDPTSKFEEIALWQYTELLETFGFRYLFGFPHNVDSGVYSAKRKVLILRYRSQW